MKKFREKWKQMVATVLIVTIFATSVSLEAFATEKNNEQRDTNSLLEEMKEEYLKRRDQEELEKKKSKEERLQSEKLPLESSELEKIEAEETEANNEQGNMELSEPDVIMTMEDLVDIQDVKLPEEQTEILEISEISDLENYLPIANSLHIRKEYGKNILSWETESDLTESVYYRVYRGTTETFSVNEDALVDDKVTENYWVDIQSIGNGTSYYKIEAVAEDVNGNITYSEVIDTVLNTQNTNASTFQKKTGYKAYLGYYDFSTPIGNGTIEKSEGNLNYTQEDISVPANQLSFDVTRNYNSQLSVSGMFGQGWTDSLHKELIKDESGNIYLLESDGSIYKFESDNSGYACSETKEYELIVSSGVQTLSNEEESIQQAGIKVTSESTVNKYLAPADVENLQDGVATATEEMTVVEAVHYYTVKTPDSVYRFNEGGQLISVLNPNGSFLLYLYNEEGKLNRVQTENAVKATLDYNLSNGLLSKITLQDQTTLEYDYSNNSLIKMSHVSADREESAFNNYEYNNGLLSVVTDRKNHRYQIAYNSGKAQSITYPNQETYTLGYESQKTTVTKKNAQNAVIYTTSTDYDSATGKVTKETAADGTVVNYEYNYAANPYLITKTRQQIAYEVIENNEVQFKTEERVTETSYNDDENVSTEISEDGTLTEYTYENQSSEWTEDLATEVVSEKDDVTISISRTEYDTSGNVLIDSDDTDIKNISVSTNTYNIKGELTSVLSKEAGLETSAVTIEYDNYGNVIREKETSSNLVNEEINTYDVMGRTLTSRDTSTGEVVSYTYDYLGRIIKTETTVDGKTLTNKSSYDNNGTVISETDASGVTTTYVYDSINRVTSRTLTKGESITYTTTYTYGDVIVRDGRTEKTITNAYIEKESYPDGTTATERYYDANGKLVKEKTGGLYVDHTYDASGNEVATYQNGTQADAQDGRITLTLYNQEGQETANILNPTVSDGKYVIGSETIITKQKYDEKGNVIEETDAEGIVTKYFYDDSSRIDRVVHDANGKKIISTAIYGTNLNYKESMIAVNDPEGRLSWEKYDGAGQLINAATFGEGSQRIDIFYKYDSRGNLINMSYEDGSYKTYTYDKRNLLTMTNSYDPESTHTNPDLQTAYIYDDLHRLIKSVDYKFENNEMTPYRYTYTGYDNFGRTVWVAEVNSNTEPTAQTIDAHKICYRYDAEDKVTAISYALVENGEVSGLQFTYNSNRWLTKVSATIEGINGSKTVREYSYDAQGKVDQIKEYPGFAGNGTVCITKDYTYNELDQVDSMVYKKGTSILESYHYEYDKNGNIIEKTEINNIPTAAAGKVNKTKEYTYDALGQLIETVITDHTDNDSEKTISYEYDKVGNRTKMTENNVVTSYTYNELDQLLNTEKRLENEVEEFCIFTYDENGNQIKEAVLNLTDPVEINYSYDAENRLSQVAHASVIDENAEPTIVQENFYNGDGQRIQKKEGEDVTNYFYQDGVVSYTTKGTSDTKAIQNLLGLEGNVIAAETIGDSNHYYLYNKDIQGSTSSILDESGNWELSYEYSDFGETLEHGTSDFENEICYTGGIYDDTTKLYYLNARYYEPLTGRFLTEDTYRGEIENLEDWHLYVYCKNDPINYVDPSGHAWKKFDSFIKKKVSKALQVKKRYNQNSSIAGANKKTLIYKQGVDIYTKIKFAKTNVKRDGCGIIAVNNIMYFKKNQKEFSKLVAEFDYNMLMDGLSGIFVGTVDKCLDAYVKSSKYYTGIKNLEDKIKNSGYGVIRICWNSGGAHYVATRYDKKKNKFYLYNDGYTNKGNANGKKFSDLESKLKGKIRNGLAVKL